jgi:hypothetical protein
MRTYTNLAWPDDPYRTSQQLYRRPSPVLASVAISLPAQPACTVPAAVAVAYLPLHRTRAITVTEATLTFGFRAASTVDAENVRELAELADLDLMQARRHAAVLAGHYLPPHLRALRNAGPGPITRGLDAREADWADRKAQLRGSATLVDIGADMGDGSTDLAGACRGAAVISSPPSLTSQDPSGAVTAEYLAAAVIEQALAIALVGARHLGHYRWDGVLATAQVMAAATWDLFQYVTWDHASCPQPVP